MKYIDVFISQESRCCKSQDRFDIYDKHFNILESQLTEIHPKWIANDNNYLVESMNQLRVFVRTKAYRNMIDHLVVNCGQVAWLNLASTLSVNYGFLVFIGFYVNIQWKYGNDRRNVLFVLELIWLFSPCVCYSFFASSCSRLEPTILKSSAWFTFFTYSDDSST